MKGMEENAVDKSEENGPSMEETGLELDTSREFNGCENERDIVEQANIIEQANIAGKRFHSCSLMNKRLENLPAMLESSWKEMKELINYYENFWMKHLDALGEENSYGFCGLFSEDGVWNEMTDFYENMKSISEVASRIVREYSREES